MDDYRTNSPMEKAPTQQYFSNTFSTCASFWWP